jgi:hypothetical protein
MSEGDSVIAGCRGLFVCSAECSLSSSLVNLNLPEYTLFYHFLLIPTVLFPIQHGRRQAILLLPSLRSGGRQQ